MKLQVQLGEVVMMGVEEKECFLAIGDFMAHLNSHSKDGLT